MLSCSCAACQHILSKHLAHTHRPGVMACQANCARWASSPDVMSGKQVQLDLPLGRPCCPQCVDCSVTKSCVMVAMRAGCHLPGATQVCRAGSIRGTQQCSREVGTSKRGAQPLAAASCSILCCCKHTACLPPPPGQSATQRPMVTHCALDVVHDQNRSTLHLSPQHPQVVICML